MAGVESEAVVVEHQDQFAQHSDSSDDTASPTAIPFWLAKSLARLLPALLIALPVCFGAVHESVYLPVMAILFLFTAALLVLAPRAVGRTFARGSSSAIAAFGLYAFLAYCLLQGLSLALGNAEHPVLGTISRLPDFSSYLIAVLSVSLFVSAYVLSRVCLSALPRFSLILIRAALASGAIVSFIALSHWFYDTGKLFWVFEPNNVFISDRARWPFVNANHLGHFLLPILFLYVATLSNQVSHLGLAGIPGSTRANSSIATLAESSHAQRRLVFTALTTGVLLTLLLSILGSLSRGSWLGLSIGLIAYYLLTRPSISPSQPQQPRATTQKSRRRSHRTRTSRQESWSRSQFLASFFVRIARPSLIVVAALVIVFFLSERGRDLIVNRIDYGLLSSRDDMRWQMYSDTAPMLKEYPWFGVGLGAWDEHYARLKTPLLSGLDPVYLHSDPLQLLSECGAVGAALLFALAAIIVYKSFRSARRAFLLNPSKGRIRSAIAAGILSFLVTCCFDFPFRIPAICVAAAIYLALTTFYIDEVKTRESTEFQQPVLN